MSAILVRPGRTLVDIEIQRDADWIDPLPRLLTGGDPLDLTDLQLDLYIRPTFDHSILIMRLSSVPAAGVRGILIDNAAAGLASISVPRATVIAALPAGIWDQFLILTEVSPAHSSFGYRELWRGALTVFEGRL